MFGKQFLNRRWGFWNAAGSRIGHRGDHQRDCDDIKKWPLRLFAESLAAMLQLALLLLACGLSRYMWSVNISILHVSIALTAVGVLSYLGIVVVRTFMHESPFQAPISIERPDSIRRAYERAVFVSPSGVAGTINLLSAAFRLWNVVKYSTFRSVQTILHMAENLNRRVRQGVHGPPSSVPFRGSPAAGLQVPHGTGLLRSCYQPSYKPLLGVSLDWLLQHILVSRDERKALYHLPTGDALAVIDALEQVSTK